MRFFDGVEGDAPRFWPQYMTIHHRMNDNDGGVWFKYAPLMEECGAVLQTSVSAHIRQLRKPKAGSHPWERRCVAPGVYEFRSWPSNVDPDQLPDTATINDEPGDRIPCPWCEPRKPRVRVKQKHNWPNGGRP